MGDVKAESPVGLVERLRAVDPLDEHDLWQNGALLGKAADTIERLQALYKEARLGARQMADQASGLNDLLLEARADLDRAVEVMKPFADEADTWLERDLSERGVYIGFVEDNGINNRAVFTLADCAKARSFIAILRSLKEPGDE
jgi:hypothetical protein